MRVLSFTVPKEFDGAQIIAFLREREKLSVKLVKQLRRTDGGVLKNGTPSRVIDKAFAGDIITVKIIDDTVPPAFFELPLDILFEDEDFLVVNKPAGLSMHPTFRHPNGTLSNAVASYLSKTGKGNSCTRAIGRLDKDTSGAAVFALNSYAAARLNGKIEKEYLAVLSGTLHGSGVIDASIYRPYKDKTIRAIGEGKSAVTHYTVLEQIGEFTLVRVFPKTGRTHQIRLHFSHIGLPLVGDEMYGGQENPNIKRAALHCEKAKFTHNITNEEMVFTALPPSDFNALIKNSAY
ncbi:MAG TPA: RluA family pseudouridine synthase [Oscillospiraceae bacterium]|nr:RluA family pseudouridine synthase [Oscillospiraceae bacterium]